ncbi:MAG: hypothetical protein Q8924_20140, partial [Bacillota bacterium]|nr:hypothetical protein [Bacillota bacterium]
NYMANELLDCLEPDLLDFLIKVSILDEFSEESVNFIFQFDNVPEYIERCESKGLFMQKLLGTTVTYRFHGLFREALHKMQENRLSPELISKNHMLAAEYYCSKQSFSRAIVHCLAAGRTDMAAGMIANASRELISLEAIGKLRLLFSTLPRDVLEGNPGLMYMKSFLYQNGEEEAKRLLDKSLDIFERAGQTEMELNTLFSLLAFHLFKNNASQADCVLESANKKASESGKSEFEKLTPVFQLVKHVWDGETVKADVLLRKSSFEEIPLNYLWTIYMYSCIHYIISGKLDMAESRIGSALQMEMVAHADILKGFCLMFQMIIAFYKNDIPVFDESLKQLHVISEKYNVLYMLAFSRIFKGLREYCLNNTDTACATLQAGLRSFDQLGNH